MTEAGVDTTEGGAISTDGDAGTTPAGVDSLPGAVAETEGEVATTEVGTNFIPADVDVIYARSYIFDTNNLRCKNIYFSIKYF